MGAPVLQRAMRLAMATGLQAELANGTLRLYSNANGTINDAMALADLTEAAYTGYAGIAVAAWSNAFFDDIGQGATAMPSQGFFGPSDSSGQAMQGCFYTHGTGGNETLDWLAPFDDPITLGSPTDFLGIGAQINTEGTGSITINGSTQT